MPIDPTDALKEDVLLGLAHEAAGVRAEDRARVDQVISNFVRFEEGTAPTPSLERIYISKGPRWIPSSGKSVKPGNLRLNLGKLFETLVSGVGVGLGAASHPIFAVFAGIVALRSLVKASTIKLTQDDALIAWATWTCEQRNLEASTQNIQALANDEATRVGYPSRLTLEEATVSLENLQRINAVRKQEETWEMIESVVVRT
jgi:hypothetical protein